MIDMRTCAACGHTGYDVTTKIVENPDKNATMKVQGHSEVYQVPRRFVAQLRCVDTVACLDRSEAMRFDDEGTLLP